MTWAQVERNCLSLGAHLASIRRAEEYHGIQRLMADKNYGNPLTWLGGFEDAKFTVCKSGSWSFSASTQADTEKKRRQSSSRIPSTMKTLILSTLLCAVITLTRAAALSEAKDEGGEVAIIQEGEHHILERSTSCPCGWTNISGRCFLFIPQTMTWAQAERNCLSLGAHLASVRRAEEYHGIQRLISDKTHGNPLTWLGGFEEGFLVLE
ncbi:ladderlectin-like isoform X3 [Micropterus salmoides]|uniref:ladderlectin-like isoform X3 n=1 Tax=Micropterus salmoides TaxID=27706 RepID=UPI0018EC3261|nr:ladderlectin-like isoform X3 [Micropterus salmoides]